MNQSNSILAKRIAYLERQLSNTKTIANTLLEENRQFLVEISSINDQLQSSMLSEATAKQYAEEVDKQNQELAAQVEVLQSEIVGLVSTVFKTSKALIEATETLERELLPALEDSEPLIELIEEFKSVVAATPQQHLAELKAQAVLDFANHVFTGNDYLHMNLNAYAHQYADSIRRGEVK